MIALLQNGALMKKILIAFACTISLVVANAPTSMALDTYYQGTLKGAKPVAVGQSFKIGGWVDYKSTKKGKKTRQRAVVTPLVVTINSFGIDDPQGACVGTPEFPTYCDEFVGGFIPSYFVDLAIQNRNKKQTQAAPTVQILCASTTSSSTQSFGGGSLPPRTRNDERLNVLMPTGIQDPSQCAEPVLLLSSPYIVETKQAKPKIPMKVYLPLSGVPLG